MAEKRPNNAPLLQIEQLRITYGRQSCLGFQKNVTRPAVNDVHLVLERGKSHAVVGESGCGKTSLAMAILGFVTPAAGRIYFRGRDLLRLPAQDMSWFRRQVQPVFQDASASLNPRHTIVRTLLLATDQNLARTEKIHKIEALMSTVGLTREVLTRYPHQLSGGQQQRVCLARALLPEPQLLILDEPISSQDISIQNQLIHLLMELKEKYQLTCLLISHDLKVVRFLADEVSVMQAGHFVETASCEQLFNHPQAAYTRSLLENMELISPHEK